MVRRWMRIVVVLVTLAGVWGGSLPAQATSMAQDELELAPKHLGGGADELDAMRLPDPLQVGTRSPYALVEVRFTPDGSGGSWSGTLAVDSGDVALLLIAPESQAWNVQVTLPDGQQYSLAELSDQSGGIHETTSIGMEEAQYPAEFYTIHGATPGLWQIAISTERATTDGLLVLVPESTYGLYTYLTTIDLVEGQPIGFNAYLYSEPLPTEPAPPEKEDAELPLPEAPDVVPEPLAEVVVEGEMVLRYPDGKEQTLPLRDDGGQGDQNRGGGRAAAALPALEPGMYQAQIHVKGTLPDGTQIERTSEQIFPVLRASVSLTGRASSRVIDDNRLSIELEVETQTALPPQLYVYTEVWGTDDTGILTPVGWAGGIVAPASKDGGQAQLALDFDTRWLALARASAPLVLRQIRVQDVDTFVPLTTADEIQLEGRGLPKGAFSERQAIDPNDPELRMGRRPAESRASSTAVPAARGRSSAILAAPLRGGNGSGLQRAALRQPQSVLVDRPRGAAVGRPVQQQFDDGILLVHGYCSNLDWPQREFDDGATVEFSDVEQNRTHDAFARLIAQQGDRAFRNWFSVVAHSQGGAAALHLHTFYWSNLENSPAPRPIQTLGTPYLGTPLAGFIAWIGKYLNLSCGPNWELTHVGSGLWLSAIGLEPRNQVFYSTTAHGQWWVFEKMCHASSFILRGIDDGVTSVWAGQLLGGHDLGMKRNWCHSSRMLYAPQYLDHVRNNEMDMYGRVSNDVGVIPATGVCPNGQGVLTIHMDDEDRRNANGRGGWIGATTSTNDMTFRFCRVPGNLFQALATTNQAQRRYAVLKLGATCPNGSVEFGRYFDNEDHNNQNWSSGTIVPNVSTSNTTLQFCLFRSGTTTMSAFPNLGISYGVFAASNFSLAIETGFVHTDDEDHNNANGYMAAPAWAAEAQQIVTPGSNTNLNMVRVQ